MNISRALSRVPLVQFPRQRATDSRKRPLVSVLSAEINRKTSKLDIPPNPVVLFSFAASALPMLLGLVGPATL